MEKLTQKEEEVMQALWHLENAFVKEIVSHLNGTNHYNTVSTIVRKLEEKKYVGYEAFGKTHRYFPVVKKEDYRNKFVNNAMTSYFNSSYKNMVSFFAKEEKISASELREILEMIESKEK
ncbi:BlaI/MecI/CopY family transcriptional regulator [uncultured Nonlabens sp.]|uniref:BlaI/MecI/CopY family transcriptional regulator n=1 Tax=uncultured Nonlabens sp. TaxID=859306 RepID=UPI00261BBA0A|nr:BlaI/MecI/CopY family transcriptional regulator [uncultured Nonlabens sp.]